MMGSGRIHLVVWLLVGFAVSFGYARRRSRFAAGA
jgi:hypothetical protein